MRRGCGRSAEAAGLALLAGALAAAAGCGPTCTDADCAPGSCDAIGQCIRSFADGEPCVRDLQCASATCLAAPAACATRCADQDECGAGLGCAPAVDIGTGVETIPVTACVPGGSAPAGAACAADADCATALCVDFLCVATCTSCAAGEACVPTPLDRNGEAYDVGICTWAFPPPELELGPAVTTADGSAEIPFDVPPGVRSFAIVLVDDDGLRVTVRTLVAPDGTVLLDQTDALADLNPADSYPGAASVLVPDTDDPAAAVQPGTYLLTAGTYDPANFAALDPVAGDVERIAVVFERAGEEGGLLDVVLHFSPATGFSAATAAADPFVAAMLDRMAAMLSGVADVGVASVEMGADLSSDHDVVEDGAEARAICAGSSEPGPRGGALNLYLVQDLTFTAGLAGGIPGPPGLEGTVASGIVAELLGTGEDTGILLAHETSHYLGLFHTTEVTGGGDPISDTPVCPSGTMFTDCPDYTNLMFPFFALDPSIGLTPGQRRVLRGAPLLYEVVRPAACPAAGGAVDVTGATGGFATGDTSVLAGALSGTCGGAAAPERVQLLRVLEDGLTSLEVRATGRDFAPAVYIRRADCADSDPAAELGCTTADAATELLLTVDAPAPGAYFIIVDGRDPGAAGTFALTVTEVP